VGKRILTAVILIPIVLFLVLRAPVLWLAVAAGVVALLALYEYLALALGGEGRGLGIVTLVTAIVFFVAVIIAPALFMLPALTAAAFLLLTVAAFTRPASEVLPATASSFFGVVYIAFPLATLPLIATLENGRSLILFLLLVVWTGDIAALYTGRAIGRHKLAPKLSPGKTWEGSAGSVAGSLIIAALLFFGLQHVDRLPQLLHPLEIHPLDGPLWYWLLLAALLNVAAQLGDLLESAIKRGAGVKDSGRLLPGHGGVLDRIDALLLAAPVLWYAQLIQQYFW
jgi:phosphatidate cytidylyltransferase